MSPSRNRQREDRPVFHDASGRRERRLRLVGAILVAPALGYIGLLLSAVLGGPTINSPFLPLPDPPAAVASPNKPTPATTTGGPARPHAVVASTPRRSPALAIPVGLPTPALIPGPTSTSAPTSTPVTPAHPPQARNEPTSAPTSTKTPKGKPTAQPTPPRRPIKTPR